MPRLLHADEIDISIDLVRRLVDQALPHYAGLPLARLAASGSSNALFRLGQDLLVRLPRQPDGTQTIEKEERWLPRVAAALPVAVPEVVAVGEAALGYSEKWSVVRWLEGHVPDAVSHPLSSAAKQQLAVDLGHVVLALRGMDVDREARTDPSLRWYRGEPLSDLDDDTQRNIAACAAIPALDLDLASVRAIWTESLALPAADNSDVLVWYHGDLVAENLLIRADRLSAVLDFGGLGVGDPTVDLIVAWDLLDAPSRDVFRSVVAVDEDEWRRGRAWALALAVMTLPYYWSTMPERCVNRLSVARAVIDDVRVHG